MEVSCCNELCHLLVDKCRAHIDHHVLPYKCGVVDCAFNKEGGSSSLRVRDAHEVECHAGVSQVLVEIDDTDTCGLSVGVTAQDTVQGTPVVQVTSDFDEGESEGFDEELILVSLNSKFLREVQY